MVFLISPSPAQLLESFEKYCNIFSLVGIVKLHIVLAIDQLEGHGVKSCYHFPKECVWMYREGKKGEEGKGREGEGRGGEVCFSFQIFSKLEGFCLNLWSLFFLFPSLYFPPFPYWYPNEGNVILHYSLFPPLSIQT